MSSRPWLKKMIIDIVGSTIYWSPQWKIRLLRLPDVINYSLEKTDRGAIITILTEKGIRHYEIKVTEKV